MKKTMLALWCAGLLSGVAQAAEVDLNQAESLMKAGRAKEAYALLAPAEFELSGNERYDYLLGTAALDSGRADRATLAFERVLAVNPAHAGARLDMARAYFALGDTTRARAEFETVLSQNPPATARPSSRNISPLSQQQEKTTTFTAYAEGNAGFDDNISAATSDFTGSVLSAYNMANVTPTGNAIRRKDGFFGLSLGAEVTHKLSPVVTLYAGVDSKQREYDSENLYDTSSLDERFGVLLTDGADKYRLGAQFQQYYQEGAVAGTTNNRESGGINLEWKRALNERNQVALFGSYSRSRQSDMKDPVTGAHFNDIDTSARRCKLDEHVPRKAQPAHFRQRFLRRGRCPAQQKRRQRHFQGVFWPEPLRAAFARPDARPFWRGGLPVAQRQKPV